MNSNQLKIVIATALVSLLFIFFLLHVQKYLATSQDYSIDQQELEFVKGDELYNQLNPLVITFIEDEPLKMNVETYHMYSSLTLFKQYNKIAHYDTNTFYRTTAEVSLIRSRNPGSTYIELYHPRYSNFFQPIREKKQMLQHANCPFGIYKLVTQENIKQDDDRGEDTQPPSSAPYIHIVIHEYNILSIPRHWYFRIHSIETQQEASVQKTSEDESEDTSSSIAETPRVNDLEVFIGNGLLTRLCGSFYS